MSVCYINLSNTLIALLYVLYLRLFPWEIYLRLVFITRHWSQTNTSKACVLLLTLWLNSLQLLVKCHSQGTTLGCIFWVNYLICASIKVPSFLELLLFCKSIEISSTRKAIDLWADSCTTSAGYLHSRCLVQACLVCRCTGLLVMHLQCICILYLY